MLQGYLSITKPGIIIGNLISVAAGFFLAAQTGEATFTLFLATLLGVAAVIASSCIVNNIFDRDIDLKMARTRRRLLATGEINADYAFAAAIVLLISGTGLIYLKVNPLSAVAVLLGYIFYVFFYTMLYKRKSVYGTLVGSISGAVPPLVGYLAVSNNFSIEAILLFLLFCLWQMPHFYAIAMFRLQDYRQANIPVLPLVAGIERARQHMIAYVVAVNLVALALFIFGAAGYEYLVVAGVACLLWARVTFRPIRDGDYVSWSRPVFHLSLVVVMAISSALGLELAVQTML